MYRYDELTKLTSEKVRYIIVLAVGIKKFFTEITILLILKNLHSHFVLLEKRRLVYWRRFFRFVGQQIEFSWSGWERTSKLHRGRRISTKSTFWYLPIITWLYPSIYTLNLWFRARQLDSVAQLVRALHRNRRAAGSIPARGSRVPG